MNGLTDEVGKVAVATVETMGKSPILLALLLLNAIGIGAACWFLVTLAEHSHARYEKLFAACLPHLELKVPAK